MTYPAVHAQIQTLLANAEADPLHLIGAAGRILLSRDEYVRSGYLADYLDLLRRVETVACYHVLLSEHVPAFHDYVCCLDILLTMVQVNALVAQNANYLTAKDRIAQLEHMRSRLIEAREVLNRFEDSLNGQAGNNRYFVTLRRRY